VALLLPQRRMLHRQCRMRRRRCRTWRRQPHRTWPHRTWQRQRRTWLRPISLDLRTTWPCRAVGHALPPRARRLTPSLAAQLIMKLPTSQRGEVGRVAEQQRVRNASAPSVARANSNTAQRALRRPRRTPSNTERPMRRPRPLRGNGLDRTVMKPLAKVPLAKVPSGPEKTRRKPALASRGIREICHVLSNARVSSAGRRSFEIRCSRVRRRQEEGRQERCRNRRSKATSPSRPCMIVAITTITI